MLLQLTAAQPIDDALLKRLFDARNCWIRYATLALANDGSYSELALRAACDAKTLPEFLCAIQGVAPNARPRHLPHCSPVAQAFIAVTERIDRLFLFPLRPLDHFRF